jgi:hypothetical protein
MSTKDIVSKHDPLAEEMDLITFQEADARLYEESARTTALIEQLQRSTDPGLAEIAAQQDRLQALERVANRLRRQRSQPPLRS